MEERAKKRIVALWVQRMVLRGDLQRADLNVAQTRAQLQELEKQRTSIDKDLAKVDERFIEMDHWLPSPLAELVADESTGLQEAIDAAIKKIAVQNEEEKNPSPPRAPVVGEEDSDKAAVIARARELRKAQESADAACVTEPPANGKRRKKKGPRKVGA